MTLTFDIHIGSCTHLVNFIYQLWHHRLQQFLKNLLFYLLPIQKHMDQIWPHHKIGQRHPRFIRVIIWTNLVVLQYPMLHINFQGHQPLVPEKKNFFMFLPYMSMAAILLMWPKPFKQTFVPPSHGASNLASIGLVVSQEKKFENVESVWP